MRIVTELKCACDEMARVKSAFLVLAAIAAAVVSCKQSAPVAASPSSPPKAATAFYATTFERLPTPAEMSAAGRRAFFDPSLSASGRLACASCHDPAHAYGPANARAVQLGGVDGKTPGLRAVPSLRYVQKVPPFTEHFFESDGNDSEDQGPAGGHTWDGRSASLHEQAALPLTSPFEMANRDVADVVRRLRASPSADALRATFGPHVLDTDPLAFTALVLALEVFQQEPAEFYPYDSKYDAYLRGQASLDASEKRGLALFNDPAKGNCASCHPSVIRAGELPAFSDWGYVALGVPRNRELHVTSPDLGLCGPLRTDLSTRADYCGRFRTPTLRNVARRGVFFHNGRFHRLEDAVRFYAERDTNPARWYPRGEDGRVQVFDDLPAAMRDNVSREPPFGRKAGAKPALDAGDVRDIVAFLKTLDDGFKTGDAPRIR
jgi:cytochrome c peroxidase